MSLSPELEREIAEAGKVIAPYINRRKAQICTQAGSTASGGNPKTGAPAGRIWVKAEGNHMPIAAWNAVAFDGLVGAWVVVADDRVSGEPTIIEVLARENVQRGGALYASQIAAGPQQSPTTQRPRHNYSAITAPTVSDDETSYYSTNSLWVNTSTGTAYICTDASTGAAVWQVIGSGSGTVETIVAGTGISVDDTDPANPIVSATGGSSANFGSEATIALDASGVLDLTSETSRNILVESESGTSDTLTEVSGLSAGEKVWLRAASGHTITVDHNNAGATDKILLYNGVDLDLSVNNPLELGKVASGKVAQLIDELGAGASVMSPVFIETSTDENSANTTPEATGLAGTTFDAPTSGKVYVTITGRLFVSNNGRIVYLGWELREGAIVGSGTVVVAATEDRTVLAGAAVTTGGSNHHSASNRYLVTGLTGGATYNIQAMKWHAAGIGTINYQSVLVEPVL